MGFTDDHMLIDYFDPRSIGICVLVHHCIIGWVTFSTIASIALSHHHNILVLFREVSKRYRRFAVKARIGLERSQGIGLDYLGVSIYSFEIRRNACLQ